MISVFIDGIDRTYSIELDSLSIQEELQRRATSCSFEIRDNPLEGFPFTFPFNLSSGQNKLTEYMNVIVWEHDKVDSIIGTTLTLKNKTFSGESIFERNLFRVGDVLTIGVGKVTEEKIIIASIDPDNNIIELVSALINTHFENEYIGKKQFGGVVINNSDNNKDVLTVLDYQIECTDFTKIFDHKLINESYEDRTALYIINDIVNNFVNLTETLEDFEYVDDAAFQVEWADSQDGGLPILDDVDFRETNKAGEFPWVNSSGTAVFTSTPPSISVQNIVGVSSGSPSEGVLALWYKQTTTSVITSVEIRIGTDLSNYVSNSFTPENDTDFHYKRIKFEKGSITGNPDWSDISHLSIIITQTGSGSIIFDGIRLNESDSFTFDNVTDSSTNFDNVPFPFVKPTRALKAISDTLGMFWYIDFDKDIHVFNPIDNNSPFSLSDNSDNFNNLSTSIDVHQLINRQIVRGGLVPSEKTTEQNISGDGERRSWILKNKMKNLVVEVDTGSGFVVKTVGIEGISDQATVDYVSNFNEKSVTATDSESTLSSTDIIRFTYNEMQNVQAVYTDNASVTRLKELTTGTGIFDGDPIVDISIGSFFQAQEVAKNKVLKYSNPVISASFDTDIHGLITGQTININDTIRDVSKNFLIQSITKTIKAGDYTVFSVQCSSTVFGIVELFQKLLDQSLTDVQNEIIRKIETAQETINVSDEIVITVVDYSLGVWDAVDAIWDLSIWQ